MLLVAVIGLMLFPVVYDLIRLGIIAGLISVWAIGLYLFWKNRAARILFVGVLLVVLLAAVCPGREADKGLMRKTYVQSLLSYENVEYIWGGETRVGIDCSGLIREAYVDANFKVGLTTLNPGLIRKAVIVWGRDCGANAIGNGYGGRTKLIKNVESLDKLRESDMTPGDMVVAKEGFHILAYIGEGILIEASPNAGKVRQISIADKAKEWKGIPIKLVHWSDM